MARIRPWYLATAVVTSVSLISPTVAVAGPDDGKRVSDGVHTDAPKPFWENNKFALSAGVADEIVDLKDLVIWVGARGWHANSAAYQFRVPEDQAFSFLGNPGDLLYHAPENPAGGNLPSFWGYGSGPWKKNVFRDNVVSLDLVSFTGPGEMEMFTTKSSDLDRRLLSSADNGPKSMPLPSAAHEHVTTTFTQPGRYQLTYRVSARDNEGKLVDSEVETLSVQVGGARPKDDATTPLAERFNAATAYSEDSSYTISYSPSQKKEKPGDENLTHISFEAGDKNSNGTLTLLNDGHFLTDLDVKDGVAEFDEFFGTETSKITAVFTPDKQSQATRWVSEPVEVAVGTTASTSKGSDALPELINVKDNKPNTYAPTSLKYTVKFEPVKSEGYGQPFKLVVDFDDKKINGFIAGGVYDNTEETLTSTPFETAIVNGHAEIEFDPYAKAKGQDIRLSIIPHPLVEARSVVHHATTDYRADSGVVTTEGELGGVDEEVSDGETGEVVDTPIDAPGPDPEETTEPEEAPTAPEETTEPETETDPDAEETCTPLPVIDSGHLDIKATGGPERLGIVLNDDSGLIDEHHSERRLDSVALKASDLSKSTKADYLKQVGIQDSDGEFYLLPMTQQDGIVWPGYNTESLAKSSDGMGYADFKELNFNLEPTSAPKGGETSLFQPPGIGVDLVRYIDTAKGQTSASTGWPRHAHLAWIFTEPGTYTFDAFYSGTTTSGEEIVGEKQTLTFLVGDQAEASCSNGSAPSADHTPTEATPTSDNDHGSTHTDSKGGFDWKNVFYAILSVSTIAIIIKMIIDRADGLAHLFGIRR